MFQSDAIGRRLRDVSLHQPDLLRTDGDLSAVTTPQPALPPPKERRAIHYSGYDRERRDFYATPGWVTEALLQHIHFRGPIWEPCCGDGAMSGILAVHGYEVVPTDIADRGFGMPGVDFLTCRNVPRMSLHRNEPAIWRRHRFPCRAVEVFKGDARLSADCVGAHCLCAALRLRVEGQWAMRELQSFAGAPTNDRIGWIPDILLHWQGKAWLRRFRPFADRLVKRPGKWLLHVYSEALRLWVGVSTDVPSGEVRHDIRREKFAGLGVAPSIGTDQQIDSTALVLPDQVNGLCHGPIKPRNGPEAANCSRFFASAAALRARQPRLRETRSSSGGRGRRSGGPGHGYLLTAPCQ
jgi:hypothetical protein